MADHDDLTLYNLVILFLLGICVRFTHCPDPLLVFLSTNSLYLPALINIIRLTWSPQPPLNQLLHTHSLSDSCCIMHYPPALLSGRISCYWTCLLPLTTSPRLCPGNLTCHLSLNFVSACCLPGLPFRRLRPHSDRRLYSPNRLPDCHPVGLVNIFIKVLNCSSLDLYFWVRPHTLHTQIAVLFQCCHCALYSWLVYQSEDKV